MAVRLNRNTLFIGRRGVGKTTIAIKMAKASGRKICVVDTDNHPAYADFKEVSLKQLAAWKEGNVKCITSEPEKALTVLNKFCSNAFIICEDAGKYITSNPVTEVKAFVIDHRKRNFDVAMMFHFLSEIPPFLVKHYETLVLFKTNDNISVNQKKFPNWHTISSRLQRIMQHPSFNYCEAIKYDE